MDNKTLSDAAIYSRIKAAALAYYHAHAQEIAERRKVKYREAHPNPRPRGRPRKVADETGLNFVSQDSNNASATDISSSVQVVS
jgi:hypothetical protein